MREDEMRKERRAIFDLADFLLANKSAVLALRAGTDAYAAMASSLKECREALPLAALLAMQENRAERAMDYLYLWGRYSQHYTGGSITIEANRYIALCALLLGNGKLGKAACHAYLSVAAGDEGMWFVQGCHSALESDWAAAQAAWKKALALKPAFAEAQRVLDYAEAGGRDVTALPSRLPYPDTMCFPLADYREIPLFINSRDRVECLRKLIDWLYMAGYRNLYILDNDSDYPALLAYYEELKRRNMAQVLFLGRNMGHTALWDSGVLDQLSIRTPYVYTDSDVVPTAACPHDVVRRLLQLLKRYPFCDKVGLGLQVDDIAFEEIKAYEQRYYRFPLERDVYFAPLDTTFALYHNIRHYAVLTAARTTGACMARHLPWYYGTISEQPADERYYRSRASSVSTMAARDQGSFSVGEDIAFF